MAAATLPSFANEPETVALPRHVLTNAGIVLLAEAGYDENFIIDLIHYRPTHFDTTVEGLAYLAKHAISERIVRAMVLNERKPAQTVVVPAPAVPATSAAANPAEAAAGTPAAPENPAVAMNGPTGSTTMFVPSAFPAQRPMLAPINPAAPSAGGAVWVQKGWLKKRWYLVEPKPVLVGSPADPVSYPAANVYSYGSYSAN